MKNYKIGKKRKYMNGVGKISSLVGDVAGLWASTQKDEKAAKIANTFNNVASVSNTIGNEVSKDIKGFGKIAFGAATGNPSSVIAGMDQVKNNGATLDDTSLMDNKMADPNFMNRGTAMARIGLYMKPKNNKNNKNKFSYIKRKG